jgi:hypothetical protein
VLKKKKSLGPMNEQVIHLRRGNAGIKYSRTFATTRNVSDVVGWYRRQLEGRGWHFSESNPSVKLFEKDPWSFEIRIDTAYKYTSPEYNFTVRLVWDTYNR